MRVSEIDEELSRFERVELRDHIGKAHRLSEPLDWCDSENDLTFERNADIGEEQDRTEYVVVPKLSQTFSNEDEMQEALSGLRDEISNHNISTYRINTTDSNTLYVFLEPYVV